MALCLHYNFSIAFVSAVCAGVCVSAAIIIGALPLPYPEVDPSKEDVRFVPYATAVTAFVFQVVLHFGHEVVSRSCPVFLDKVCIHQTDESLKMQGISYLGLTIFYSRTMVILDSESYFERLWTVFEVASRLVQGGGNMLFLPVNLPAAILLATVVLNMGTVMFLFLVPFSTDTLPHIFIDAFYVIIMAIVVIIMRMWAREQSARKTRLQTFSIRQTKCTVEADRILVEQGIARLIMDAELIQDDRSTDEALDEFDSMVREQLPLAVERSSVTLPHCLVLGLTFVGRGFDDLGRTIRSGHTWRKGLLYLLFAVCLGLVAVPQWMILTERLTKCSLHFVGIAEKAFMMVVVILGLVLGVSWNLIGGWLVPLAETSDAMVVVLFVFISLQELLVIVAFRDSRHAPSAGHDVNNAASREAAAKFRFNLSTCPSASSTSDTNSVPDEEPFSTSAPVTPVWAGLPRLSCVSGENDAGNPRIVRI